MMFRPLARSLATSTRSLSTKSLRPAASYLAAARVAPSPVRAFASSAFARANSSTLTRPSSSDRMLMLT